jgi:hypothetical protein
VIGSEGTSTDVRCAWPSASSRVEGRNHEQVRCVLETEQG